MKTKPTTLKQQLSKDMKKQGHVTKKKPSNKKLSSEEALAETPKKGTYREPNSKKLSSETSLQKTHKLVHLKEFNSFELEPPKAVDVTDMEDNFSEDKKVRVKHLIEYLQTLDPEAEVSLDKDGWDYHETPIETVKNAYLFDYWTDEGEKYLIINN
jgi:hypothetical protein